jgi:hypothetical protein
MVFDIYHRTRSNPSEVIKGFIKRMDALYGTVDGYESNAQYGGNIIHYKVPNNGRIIITDKDVAIKYFGDQYHLKTQFMNCLGEDFEKYDDLEQKSGLPYKFYPQKDGMLNAISVAQRLRQSGVTNKVDGLVYGSQQLGSKQELSHIISLFKSEIAIPYRYSTNEGETWIKV